MAIRIPGALMPHRIEIAPKTGDASDGPVYGPARDVRAYVEASSRTGADDVTIVEEGRVYVDPEVIGDEQSRVRVVVGPRRLIGATFVVLRVDDYDHPRAPSHRVLHIGEGRR